MAIGKHITLIVPEDRRAEEDDVLARLRRGERIDHFETVRVARDGRLIDVSLTVSPVRDGFGRIVGASKVARDVSERRRLDEYRDVLLKHEHEARTAAEALIRAKDQFLATISHSSAHRSMRSLAGQDFSRSQNWMNGLASVQSRPS